MNLPEEQILDRIQKVCTEVLKVDSSKVSISSRFREDLGADSLDTIVLLMALEEEFEEKISDEDAQRLRSVRDVLGYVTRRSTTAS